MPFSLRCFLACASLAILSVETGATTSIPVLQGDDPQERESDEEGTQSEQEDTPSPVQDSVGDSSSGAEAGPLEADAQPAVVEEAAPAVANKVTPNVADPRPRPARYRAPEEREELFARWTANGLAERIALGESAGGRALLGVVIAAPGPIPVAQRTTILVVGGLDGRSLVGSEAATRVIEDVLAATERLTPDVAVVVVPWANPDGLARTLSGIASDSNATQVDEDQDGLFDEDGPDDLDGDGAILSMLIEDPEGDLVRAGDGRFLRPATSRDLERWRLVPEGRDDDGDGRFNEDGPGGIRLDADFPVGWTPGPGSALEPLSQPEVRALAALMRGRRVSIALFLQGNHGQLGRPGGTAFVREHLSSVIADDGAAWREVERSLGGSRGLEPRDLQSASGRERPGHPVDWLYSARGTLALEWSLWGPEFGRESGRESEAPSNTVAAGHGSQIEAEGWVHWLDDTRGGLGFVDWVPVEPVNGRRALVGGWEARTTINPPEDVLPAVISGVGDRVLDLIEGLPRLVLEVESRKRTGGLVELELRVRNTGRLPSGVGPVGHVGSGLKLEISLPEGTQLLAGALSVQMGHLQPGASSESISWLIQGPEHAILGVALQSAWGGRMLEEVRL